VARAARIRRAAGWFDLPGRGLIRVRGSDRVRWTNGMVSNDVAELAPGPERSGCHALLLTAQGRIVADLHVLAREQELWLELDRGVLPDVQKRLERYVISDDVALSDASDEWRRFAIEGPRASELLARVAGADVAIVRDSGVDLSLAGADVVACAWGWSGEPAYQLFVPAGASDAVARAFSEAGGAQLERGDAEVLEVLRIEAGTPRQGAELGEDVLPAETGLVGRAVSLSKGCYTGQEIVARMESRGSASHRLVGLHFDAQEGEPPLRGAPVLAGQEVIGSVTSACRSAVAGTIALAYLRRAHAEPGGAVEVSGKRARIAALPFVVPSRTP
jgi:folate-binding protein YgfZ